MIENNKDISEYSSNEKFKEYKIKKKKSDKLEHEYIFHLLRKCNKKQVTGYIYVKDGKEQQFTNNTVDYYIVDDNLNDNFDSIEEYYEIRSKAKPFTKVIGYIRVDDEEYIALCRQIHIIILIAPIIILSLLFSVQVLSKGKMFIGIHKNPETEAKNDLKLADTVEWDGEYIKPPMSQEDTFTLIGREFYNISEEERYIPLMNSDTNDVYLEYQVYNEDNTCLLESSGLIAPGQSYQFDCYDLVEDGTNIYYIIKCYDLLSYECCSETQLDGISIRKY